MFHERQAIDISKQMDTLQIQTPKSVGATQHAEGHTAVRGGPYFKSLDFSLVAFALHQLPQVDLRVSTHSMGLYFTFQPINKCAFLQTLVENTNACTFSASHNDVFCPLGSPFH